MLDLLRKSLPKTKVVAIGLLPRGEEVGTRSFNRVVRAILTPRCRPSTQRDPFPGNDPGCTT